MKLEALKSLFCVLQMATVGLLGAAAIMAAITITADKSVQVRVTPQASASVNPYTEGTDSWCQFEMGGDGYGGTPVN